MQTLITWIAYGLGALFFAACVVAWWEHLGREGRRAEEPDWEAAPRKLASVDVDLDTLLAAAPAGDVSARRQALGGAITRMASGDRRQGFGDTAPMVLPGASADAQPDTAVAERRELRQGDKVAAGE
jgi:hypothetical protein